MELFILVSYLMGLKMGMDNRFGKMDQSMMDSGKEIKLMAKEL